MPDYKILILDYEPRGIKQLSEPLENAGYAIQVCKDGLTGIEVFNSSKPDLTLIEAMLPKKHGFEVCQELKKTPHGTRTPIVIVTSVYKGRKYRTQALHHYGCDEYLEKPIEPEKLLETVERLIGASVSTSPPAAEAAPAPPAPRPAAPAADGIDPAEAEIMERLDELMPGGLRGSSDSVSSNTGDTDSNGEPSDPGRSGTTKSSIASSGDRVLSFDPQRSRKMSAPTPAPRTGSTPITAHGNAEPISFEAIEPAVPEPERVVPELPELIQVREHAVEPIARNTSSIRLGIVLLILAAATLAYFLFSPPSW